MQQTTQQLNTSVKVDENTQSNTSTTIRVYFFFPFLITPIGLVIELGTCRHEIGYLKMGLTRSEYLRNENSKAS